MNHANKLCVKFFDPSGRKVFEEWVDFSGVMTSEDGQELGRWLIIQAKHYAAANAGMLDPQKPKAGG